MRALLFPFKTLHSTSSSWKVLYNKELIHISLKERLKIYTRTRWPIHNMPMWLWYIANTNVTCAFSSLSGFSGFSGKMGEKPGWRLRGEKGRRQERRGGEGENYSDRKALSWHIVAANLKAWERRSVHTHSPPRLFWGSSPSCGHSCVNVCKSLNLAPICEGTQRIGFHEWTMCACT